MRLIHASGFDPSERESFRVIVFANILLSMQIMLEIVEHLHIPLQHESNSVSLWGYLFFFCVLLTNHIGTYFIISRCTSLEKKRALPDKISSAIKVTLV